MVKITLNAIHSFQISFKKAPYESIIVDTPTVSDMKASLNPYDSKSLDIDLSIHCNLSLEYWVFGSSYKKNGSSGSKASIQASFSLSPVHEVELSDFNLVVQNTIGCLQDTLKTIYRYDIVFPLIPPVNQDNFADEANRAYYYYYRPAINTK